MQKTAACMQLCATTIMMKKSEENMKRSDKIVCDLHVCIA